MNLSDLDQGVKLAHTLKCLTHQRDSISVRFTYSHNPRSMGGNIPSDIAELESQFKSAMETVFNSNIKICKEELIKIGIEGIDLENEPKAINMS